jgi:hypothetical protein
VEFKLDAQTYGDVEPPDIDVFCGHGLALRRGANGIHTLYVVNHSAPASSSSADVGQPGRESIEVLEVDATGPEPRVTWVGAIVQAPGVWGNAVTPLPDGGIAATNYLDLRDPNAFDKVFAGEITGNLKEWHPGTGWEDVPGSELCAPNGVEVSPDGRWYFVASWVPRMLVRLSRGKDPIEKETVNVGLLADNVKWSPDGYLLVTGQDGMPAEVFAEVDAKDVCNFPFHVVKIHPQTLATEEIVRVKHDVFGTATTALVIGDELWVGSARSDRIAYFAPA